MMTQKTQITLLGVIGNTKKNHDGSPPSPWESIRIDFKINTHADVTVILESLYRGVKATTFKEPKKDTERSRTVPIKH